MNNMNKINNLELMHYIDKYFDKAIENKECNLSEEYYQVAIYLSELKRYRELAEQNEWILKKIYE